VEDYISMLKKLEELVKLVLETNQNVCTVVTSLDSKTLSIKEYAIIALKDT